MITVAIPVLNGARYLGEVLGAVRSQQVGEQVEILVVDSGSTDGSLEIARDHGARIHEIPKHEFSHGGTRNLMMSMARGDRVAFLTQDATPAHEGWLAALIEGFEVAPDVAAVFGPHRARPNAIVPIHGEMVRHFATWGHETRYIDIQRLDRSREGIAAYRAGPGRLTFLSDVNCAIARWAWEQVPYRAVPYAEDQLLGRELIEAGFAKVFHPGAAVLHSHDYSPSEFFRRYFDEFRGFREVLGHREPFGPVSTPRAIWGLTRGDLQWLRSTWFVPRKRMLGPLLVSLRHNTIRMTAAAIGSRSDRLPARLRRALSLEGRATFTPWDTPESPILGQPPADDEPVFDQYQLGGRYGQTILYPPGEPAEDGKPAPPISRSTSSRA